MGVQITSLWTVQVNMQAHPGLRKALPSPLVHPEAGLSLTREEATPTHYSAVFFLSLPKVKDIHGQLPAADVTTWHP